MSAATPDHESLTDAVALIAICKGSVALAEVALSLQVVAAGVTEVPEEARKNRIFARVHRRITNPAWLAAARAALGNEGLGRVGACFREGCFQYATPKTARFYDDEEWLRGIQFYFLLEENMRVLAEMLLELMQLPEVDVAPRQAPVANPRPVASPPPAPVASPQPAMPPQPLAQPQTVAPPAEWAIPIALIAIGKAERNPLWVSFGATVGCLSGFWNHEPKLAADPQFSVAAKTMLATPRGFEMASALLHDPVLRTASQAMMMRWHSVARGSVSSEGLREAMAVDAELAVRADAVLRATSAIVQAFVKPNEASSTKVASETPPTPAPAEAPKPVAKPAPKPCRMNIRPPALRFVPVRMTMPRPLHAPLARERRRPSPARPRHQIPDVEPYAMRPPEPRSRSPPAGSLRASSPFPPDRPSCRLPLPQCPRSAKSSISSRARSSRSSSSATTSRPLIVEPTPASPSLSTSSSSLENARSTTCSTKSGEASRL